MNLKPKYQDLNDDFYINYNDRGCSCFINSPCSWYTHPGNPSNLECTDDIELSYTKKI